MELFNIRNQLFLLQDLKTFDEKLFAMGAFSMLEQLILSFKDTNFISTKETWRVICNKVRQTTMKLKDCARKQMLTKHLNVVHAVYSHLINMLHPKDSKVSHENEAFSCIHELIIDFLTICVGFEIHHIVDQLNSSSSRRSKSVKIKQELFPQIIERSFQMQIHLTNHQLNNQIDSMISIMKMHYKSLLKDDLFSKFSQQLKCKSPQASPANILEASASTKANSSAQTSTLVGKKRKAGSRSKAPFTKDFSCFSTEQIEVEILKQKGLGIYDPEDDILSKVLQKRRTKSKLAQRLELSTNDKRDTLFKNFNKNNQKKAEMEQSQQTKGRKSKSKETTKEEKPTVSKRKDVLVKEQKDKKETIEEKRNSSQSRKASRTSKQSQDEQAKFADQVVIQNSGSEVSFQQKKINIVQEPHSEIVQMEEPSAQMDQSMSEAPSEQVMSFVRDSLTDTGAMGHQIKKPVPFMKSPASNILQENESYSGISQTSGISQFTTRSDNRSCMTIMNTKPKYVQNTTPNSRVMRARSKARQTRTWLRPGAISTTSSIMGGDNISQISSVQGSRNGTPSKSIPSAFRNPKNSQFNANCQRQIKM